MVSILNRSLLRSFAFTSTRSISSAEHRPLMLMNIPRIAYPNVFLMMKNFFSRVIINGYFDSTFAIKSFTEGARQAVTVVSQQIANGQFEDLSSFVTREVINEVKQNFEQLSSEQKQQIPVRESEIVFSHPYLIDLTTDEQAKIRLVEITMIFHILQNPEFYQKEMLENTSKSLTTWASTVKKMRKNIIICNYRFRRDMSKNAQDNSWTITGLNHWLPNEYLQQ